MPAEVGLDGTDRNGLRCRGHRATPATDRAERGHLVDGAPAAALQAASHPLGGQPAALRAAVLRTRVGHAATVSGGCDSLAEPRATSGEPEPASALPAGPARPKSAPSPWPRRPSRK